MVVVLVQKWKRGEKDSLERWGSTASLKKKHEEMKGIIQMTILEALVHFHQALTRCWNYNIRIDFFFLFLLFFWAGRNFSYLPMSWLLSFACKFFHVHSTETYELTRTIDQTRNLDNQLKTYVSNIDRKRQKKKKFMAAQRWLKGHLKRKHVVVCSCTILGQSRLVASLSTHRLRHAFDVTV